MAFVGGTIADIGAYPFTHMPVDPPEVDFAPSGTYGTSPYPVQFTSSSTGGPITSWLWDFGDGGSSQLAHPAHTYLVSDTTSFTVALVAAGGLAAALSTAAGLFLAISSAISHDLLKGMIAPGISEKKELLDSSALYKQVYDLQIQPEKERQI